MAQQPPFSRMNKECPETWRNHVAFSCLHARLQSECRTRDAYAERWGIRKRCAGGTWLNSKYFKWHFLKTNSWGLGDTAQTHQYSRGSANDFIIQRYLHHPCFIPFDEPKRAQALSRRSSHLSLAWTTRFCTLDATVSSSLVGVHARATNTELVIQNATYRQACSRHWSYHFNLQHDVWELSIGWYRWRSAVVTQWSDITISTGITGQVVLESMSLVNIKCRGPVALYVLRHSRI